MKIGIIGPNELVSKVKMVINKEFTDIIPVDMSYILYTEVPHLIQNYQDAVDLLLFCGTTPYMYARNKVVQNMPWEFIPHHVSSLFRALLEGLIIKNYNILNMTIDSYDCKLLIQTFEEIGLQKKKIDILCANAPFGEKYHSYLYLFHMNNFNQGRVSCCATALYSVYYRLKQQGIPTLLIDPTKSIIKETLQKAEFKYKTGKNKKKNIVVIYVKIEWIDEYAILNKNEYRTISNRMKIAEQIYVFAGRIEAAVVEIGLTEFLLFSTRSLVESETNNFCKVDIIKEIFSSSISTTSIGIGYGETVIEAKHNANRGMIESRRQGGDRAYIVFNEKSIIGPIGYDASKKADTNTIKVDEQLFKISKDTGLSINSIFKLYNMIKVEKRYTSRQLAQMYNISIRSMNRMIESLEKGGYCKIVGKKITTGVGRPARLIEFDLFK
jgi:hypothetical protein